MSKIILLLIFLPIFTISIDPEAQKAAQLFARQFVHTTEKWGLNETGEFFTNDFRYFGTGGKTHELAYFLTLLDDIGVGIFFHGVYYSAFIELQKLQMLSKIGNRVYIMELKKAPYASSKYRLMTVNYYILSGDK
ncbi:unnamed protein product [Caenorhabditis angaria]|uniref:Nuclear transport factor 2 family protein n=1 Tax=Caenorhabditis angaria TaxID=860376 RepID=A0A9P1N272_9PELO|nr:unnamed protein product [Caenorhabditis angaria]